MFSNLPSEPFQSDGCSGGLSKAWKFLVGRVPPFEFCCYSHDEDYYLGSGKRANGWLKFKDRLRADNKLFCCVWQSARVGKVLALLIWLAVRFGGGSYLPTAYRWGFGWFNQRKK